MKFIAYTRVSTVQQGRSGLGLEAQQAAVQAYVSARGELVGQYTEIETGKGANALDKRPELRAALSRCRSAGAVLVIAKLDRLARNVHFVSGLIKSGIDFVAADMPGANKVMIQMHAVMSEWERDQIAARTRSALAAAKARGVELGKAGPANLRPNIEARRRAADEFADRLAAVLAGFQAANVSQREQVRQLNQLGIGTARGGRWGLLQLQRVHQRLNARADQARAIAV
jgi:DNA invertase Pin-like site-specific DNA recombinase